MKALSAEFANVPQSSTRLSWQPRQTKGHIMIKLRKESGLRDTSTPTGDVEFPAGAAYCQAIFKEFGVTDDDFSDGERTGGFGSTGN